MKDKQMPDKYQVFISFKNLDEDGNPTEDRRLAQEVYTFLVGKGLHVFLSTVTLQALGVSAYKEAIDDALDSTSAVVVVGTSAENLNSPWVRYEWDSYFNDILTGVRPSGRVFAYVKDIPTRELPRPLRQTTTISHGAEGLARLYQFIANVLAVADVPARKESTAPTSIKGAVGPTPESPDIFLSYPPQKAGWVRRNLYDPLIARYGAGRIFFDAHEVDPGAGWLGQVGDALERCRAFVPVYCPEYFNSDMCHWELSTVLAGDLAGKGGRIIPIMLGNADGSIPLYVKFVAYLDVSREDFHRRLLAALDRKLLHPA